MGWGWFFSHFPWAIKKKATGFILTWPGPFKIH
jgi:hypothetical protein